MATLNALTEAPNPVPSGTTGTITVTFNTNPGTPDQTADISIYDNGTLVNSASAVVLKGVPAETTPTVALGSTNTGWELRTTSGVLTSLGSNTFSIAHS